MRPGAFSTKPLIGHPGCLDYDPLIKRLNGRTSGTGGSNSIRICLRVGQGRQSRLRIPNQA
jgi:hypothetical protein